MQASKMFYCSTLALLTTFTTLSVTLCYRANLIKVIKQTRAVDSLSFPLFSTSISTDETKKVLLSNFEASSEPIYVCPATLNSLQLQNRFYGLVQETYYFDKVDGRKYYFDSYGQYADLTIASESSKPFFALSLNELVGQKFFQVNIFIHLFIYLGNRSEF